MSPRFVNAFPLVRRIWPSGPSASLQRWRPGPRAAGIAASMIGRGLAELSATDQPGCDRVCRPGSGKPLMEKDPTLLADLLAMVEPDARRDPMPPSVICCISRSSACRPTARCAKEGATRIAMLGSRSSTRACKARWPTASRSSRLTRGRNSSESSRLPARHGVSQPAAPTFK